MEHKTWMWIGAIALGFGQMAAVADVQGLRYIGSATVPTGTLFSGTTVGGLSGITYDAATDEYYAISDDRTPAARFYSLDLRFDLASVSGVTFNSVTTLTDTAGGAFAASTVDAEAIRLSPTAGRLLWASEGNAAALVSPFVREMNPDGTFVRQFNLPAKYTPAGPGVSGVRNNLSLESLAVTPDGTTVYAATENALIQDGPAATSTASSPSRVVQFDFATGNATAEYVYEVDALSTAMPMPGFDTNGLSELLALDNAGHFLALERSLTFTHGLSARLYLTTIDGATNVLADDTLNAYTPMSKTLIYDFATPDLTLINLEGITFGPVICGRQTVVLVADNNFNALFNTQFLMFEVIPEPAGAGALGAGVLLLARRGRR